MSQKIKQVIKRDGAVVPFISKRITNAIYRALIGVGRHDRDLAQEMSSQVVAILEETIPPGGIPSVEEIQDIVEAVLIKNGQVELAKAYILYRADRARGRAEKTSKSHRTSGSIPYRKIWHVFSWAVDHDVNTVERLNARIAHGEFPDIVRATDAAYVEDVAAAADLIIERRGEVRMVIIAGPSSSGKTTTTIKLGQRLEQEGLGLAVLKSEKPTIIEYTDVPEEIAIARFPSGQLLFPFGSIAVHIISIPFAERVAQGGALPWHVARKQYEIVDELGHKALSPPPGCYKFERFVFDALSFADECAFVEVRRAAEFGPVKNAKGEDSPDAARRLMQQQWLEWLREAGATFPMPKDLSRPVIEISPLYAADAAELKERTQPGWEPSFPLLLEP